jgi:carbamoyltransferase
VALVRDGHIECVLEEERFNRTKRTKAFPSQSLTAAIAAANLTTDSIDAIVTPWDERKLRSFLINNLIKNFPASLNLMHARAHPAQRNQIVLLSHYLNRDLKRHFGGKSLPKVIGVGHHNAHAASFFVSPFDEALVLVMDGYGDDASSSAYIGKGNRVERVWSTAIANSLGLVYTFVTAHLGFEGFGDEGKVMALAAYGSDTLVGAFRDVVKPTPDGSYAVDMSYFSYDTYGQIKPFKHKFIDRFGPARIPGSALTARDHDLAYALQKVTEEIVLHIVRGLLQRHPMRNLVMTGGVALNCVANARVLAETSIDRLWVPPCASDTGAPLGAALWHTHQTLGLPRVGELSHPYFGTAPTDQEMTVALDRAGIAYERLDERNLIDRVANDLANQRIVGWYQGRFEMGPRALGNRSILADPRSVDMRQIINTRIKKRENFRPFAPAVPLERAAEFFEITQPDPFMTLAPRVRPDKRDLIPAAVHVDGTGRIQTVEQSANPRYHALLTAFGRLTGVPVLINTSFNEQEPIVARPEEAIACFQRTAMDVLVLGDCYAVRPGIRDIACANPTHMERAKPATTESPEVLADPGLDPARTTHGRLHSSASDRLS